LFRVLRRAVSPAGIAFSDFKDVPAVRPLFLACLAYLSIAVPASTLGLLWPSMQVSLHEPVGALGILLVSGTVASVIISAATGQILSRVRVGPLLPLGTLLVALALGTEALASSLWVVAAGAAIFGFGFGAIDSALNAHAASNFGARDMTWMHASYGLGATIGPLLVTALLSDGLSWRWAYGTIAMGLVAVAVVLLLARRSWESPQAVTLPPGRTGGARSPEGSATAGHRRRRPAGIVLSALIFAAVETGIESGAGIWGYVFLTSGRGLSHETAAVTVSAYWAMMFLGRAVLGPVAERAGAGRVLAGAVAGVTLGAALMALPGPGFAAILGMAILGLAAAPIFPLLTLTTAQRTRAADVSGTTRTVGLQVAASTIGSAVLPAGLGLAIGTVGAGVLAPSLLGLALAMCGCYRLLSRMTRQTSSGSS
jgi:fucose permease